jgi:dihydrofolate reductase
VSCFRVEWEVIAEALLSLDGVMQAPGGPEEDPTGGFKFGGRVVPYADGVLGQGVGKLFSQPFDLLLGRKTYEIFAAHWSYAEGGDDDAIAKLFNGTMKYVATRSHGLDLGGFGRAA